LILSASIELGLQSGGRLVAFFANGCCFFLISTLQGQYDVGGQLDGGMVHGTSN
jgi:hypothetical protein